MAGFGLESDIKWAASGQDIPSTPATIPYGAAAWSPADASVYVPRSPGNAMATTHWPTPEHALGVALRDPGAHQAFKAQQIRLREEWLGRRKAYLRQEQKQTGGRHVPLPETVAAEMRMRIHGLAPSSASSGSKTSGSGSTVGWARDGGWSSSGRPGSAAHIGRMRTGGGLPSNAHLRPISYMAGCC